MYLSRKRSTGMIPVIMLCCLFAGCASSPRHPHKAYQSGKWNVAIQDAELWLELHPADSTVREMMGLSALNLGDSARALEMLRPLAMQTKNEELRGSILDAAMSAGDLELARSMITREITHASKDEGLDRKFARVERRVREGLEAETAGDSALALKDWTRAARNYRTAVKVHAGQGRYQAKLHLAQAEIIVDSKGEEAEESVLRHVTNAMELWPGSALSWWIKGDVCMKLGMIDEARIAFKESILHGIGLPYLTRARAVVESRD